MSTESEELQICAAVKVIIYKPVSESCKVDLLSRVQLVSFIDKKVGST